MHRAATRTLTALMGLVAMLATAAPAMADPHPDTYDARERTAYEQDVEDELLTLINEARQDPGKYGYDDASPAAPMAGWTDIRTVARGWAQELPDVAPCESGDPSCHNVPPNSDVPFYEEYGCVDGYGEAVFSEFEAGAHTPSYSAEEMAQRIASWIMHSPSHRTRLMTPSLDEFGVGIHVNGYDHEDFGPVAHIFGVVNYRDRDHSCAVDGERYFGPATDPEPDPDPTPTPDPDPTPDPEPDPGVGRAAGGDRVETAILLAGQVEKADTVLVAFAGNYPDALAAAPLAGVHDAPVLLTGEHGLDHRVAAEIGRLGASNVMLLGGEAVLSAQVGRDAEAVAGVEDVRRVQGPDRFATAVAAAGEAADQPSWDGTVILVEGANPSRLRGWPDALAASGYATATRTPILLTHRDTLPEPTRAALAALRPSRLVVVGGTAAVSGSVADQAAAAAGLAAAERWAGASRYLTSIDVDRHTAEGPGPVFLATGLNFADALAAGPVAGLTGGTLLLVHGHDTGEAATVADWVATEHPSSDVVVAGGTTAVSNDVADLFR